MILINLLPHREERRQRRKQAFFVGLGLSAAAGALVVGLWYLVLQQLISTQEQRNAYLSNEIRDLESQIKDIADLRGEIESLKARQKAVEDLQTDRNMPVHLLNELVRQTPEGIYLTSIKQSGQTVNVVGIAQTNERVAEFLRNTANASPWLERPELLEIKQSNAGGAGRDKNASSNQNRLFDFSVRLSMKRPQEPQPGSAASAPSGSPSPGAVETGKPTGERPAKT